MSYSEGFGTTRDLTEASKPESNGNHEPLKLQLVTPRCTWPFGQKIQVTFQRLGKGKDRSSWEEGI